MKNTSFFTYKNIFSLMACLLMIRGAIGVRADSMDMSDHDQDGHIDSVDVDDDGDGFPDSIEQVEFRGDHDNDGVPDAEDTDSDNDGILDASDTSLFDHDNDGHVDERENRLITSGRDKDADGIVDRVEKKAFKHNHDNDTEKDSVDTDDDNDGILDSEEAKANRRDHDNDGLKDKVDLDDDNDDINDFDESKKGGWFDSNNDDISDRKEYIDAHENETIDDSTDDTPEDEAPVHEAETVDVSIEGFAFHNTEITIHVGDTVTWTNNDSTTHTASEELGTFTSGDLVPGESYSFTFTEPGAYNYYCFYHPSMEGVVTVEE